MAHGVYIAGSMPTREEIEASCCEAIQEYKRYKRKRLLLLWEALIAVFFTAGASFLLGRLLGEYFYQR